MERQCVIELIRKRGIMGLAGREVDVDTLQEALQELGYSKGSKGREGCWYENIIDQYGYVAHLEAVSPDAKKIVTAVVTSFDTHYVTGVQERPYEMGPLSIDPFVDRALSIVGYAFLLLVQEWVTYGIADYRFEQSIVEELEGFFDELDKVLKSDNLDSLMVFRKELIHELTEGNYFDKSADFVADVEQTFDQYIPVSDRVRSWMVGTIKEAKSTLSRVVEEKHDG